MRILVYRALGLGDFLTGVPAYRALRRRFPDSDLVLAAPEALRPLVELTGAVLQLLPTGELQPPAWTGASPDLAVNLHGRGPQSHRLLSALGPSRLIAFASPEGCVDGPRWLAGEHEVDRWCRLLTESAISADPADLMLSTRRDSLVVSGATVVHPGAADPHRRWPSERFAAVAAALADAGHHVVVTGIAEEHRLARRVAELAGLPHERVLAGALDLGRLAALVAAARLVVCGDTGVAHLATAFGTPSVLLFGPTPPTEWGPPETAGRHRVLWHADGSRAERLFSIGVEEVLAATRLADRARGQSAGASSAITA